MSRICVSLHVSVPFEVELYEVEFERRDTQFFLKNVNNCSEVFIAIIVQIVFLWIVIPCRWTPAFRRTILPPYAGLNCVR